MSPGLMKMMLTFIGFFLMFASVGGAIWGREKLTGIARKFVLFLSFICLVVAGFITFVIVFSGPTS